MGTRLSRVHSASFEPTEFNQSVAASNLRGGRFDATPEDQYAFLYAASDDATAIAEVLLRDLPIDRRGAQLLPARALRNRQLSWIEPTTDLPLVSLRSGEDLAAVAQDQWLVSSPASEFAMTRRWALAIRAWAPWAAGFAWPAHREPSGTAYVFFGDRCPTGCFEVVTADVLLPPDARAIDEGPGAIYVREILSRYRVTLFEER